MTFSCKAKTGLLLIISFDPFTLPRLESEHPKAIGNHGAGRVEIYLCDLRHDLKGRLAILSLSFLGISPLMENALVLFLQDRSSGVLVSITV